MYDILGFLNFLYLPQITQYIFFHLSLLVTENILVLFYNSFHIRQEKMNMCNPAKFYFLL